MKKIFIILALLASTPAYALTLTVYPDPGMPGSTSVDANIANQGGGGASWATVHDATDGTGVDDTGIGEAFVSTYTSGGNYLIRKFLTFFDTSALTAGAVVSSASEFVYRSEGNGDADSTSYNIFASSLASNVSVTTSDGSFSSCNTTGQATGLAYGSISNAAYNEWVLNGTGIGNIALAGVTKFCMRTQRDVDNSAPTGINQIGFLTADTAGTGSDPQLVITYTLAVASSNLMSPIIIQGD